MTSIENLMGEVQGRIDSVKRWHHSPQRHQWMALALMELESNFRRLTGYRILHTRRQSTEVGTRAVDAARWTRSATAFCAFVQP